MTRWSLKSILITALLVLALPGVAGAKQADRDRDGMPDAWERFYKLNPNDPGDRNRDFDRTGYTNLEKYINGRADGTYPGK